MKMTIEAAKVALESLRDGDDGEKQADAEEVENTSSKSESAKVTAEDAEIADLKRQNDLREARVNEMERQAVLEARMRTASQSGASRRSQRSTQREHWGAGGDDECDDDGDDDEDDQ